MQQVDVSFYQPQVARMGNYACALQEMGVCASNNGTPVRPING